MSIARITRKRGDIEWHAYSCGVHGVSDFPGATTIINKKGKQALDNWFKKQGALAALRNLPGLSQMVETSGEGATVEFLAKAADKLRDDKGDIGTRIHSAIESIVKRQPFEMTEDIGASVEGFRKFMNDRRPDVKASEFMIISESQRYGATGDLAIVLDLREWGLPHEKALVCADAKTGFLAETVALQLAAIARGDHSGQAGDTKVYRVPPFTHFAALAVKPDGTEVVPYDVTDAEFTAFLACRDLYEWDRQRSRKVRAA